MIDLYTKPNCPQCSETRRMLDRYGIEYNLIDVDEDEKSLQMIKDAGYKSMPVVFAEYDNWEGFRPDKIMKIKISQ